MASLITAGPWTTSTRGLSIEDVALLEAPPTVVVGLTHTSPRRDRGPSSSGDGEARVCLTPHSAEACLMEGIDPRDLFVRSLESFAYGAHVDRNVAQMRRDAYERLRHGKLTALRRARGALLVGRLPEGLGVASATLPGGALPSAAVSAAVGSARQAAEVARSTSASQPPSATTTSPTSQPPLTSTYTPPERGTP
jgi:hypothetical protein